MWWRKSKGGDKAKAEKQGTGVAANLSKMASTVVNMGPDLVVFKCLQLALGDILYIDRVDVRTDLNHGIVGLSNVDIKPAGVNKLLAGLNLPEPPPGLRLVTGFLEFFEINGMFLSDLTDGKVDKPVVVTVRGLDLLFETKTPVEEPVEPKEDESDVSPLLDSILKYVELDISKVHIRIQHDDGEKLAFGIVLGERDSIAVKHQGPIAAHTNLALHKRIGIPIPAMYADVNPALIGQETFDQEAAGGSSQYNPLSSLQRHASAKKKNQECKFVDCMAQAAQKDRGNKEIWVMAVSSPHQSTPLSLAFESDDLFLDPLIPSARCHASSSAFS
jgi:hypothetical protein